MYDRSNSRSRLAGILVATMTTMMTLATACDADSEATGPASVIASTAPAASLDSPIHAIFPAATCRSGFRQAGPRLCISTAVQAPATYVNAVSSCRGARGQVCSYEDLSYLYLNSNLDATYDPNARWIGNMAGDDVAFCGNAAITSNNDADIVNFEGVCNKTDARGYWCCHDDLE